MMTGLFVCAWLILWLAPETNLGRLLHRWLLDRPIARVARITRGQVLLTAFLLFVAIGAVWLLKAEAGPLLGLVTPDLAVLIASFEVTTWLDAAADALLLATTVRWRSLDLGRFTKLRPRPGNHRRARRSRRHTRLPANDDERLASGIAVDCIADARRCKPSQARQISRSAALVMRN